MEALNIVNALVSIALGLVTIVSIVINIYQFFTSKEEKKNTKILVRAWQNQAEGLKNALLNISYNPNNFTNKQDVLSAINAVAQSAVSLDKAMAEERFYSEDEVKEKKEETEKEMKKLFKLTT